MTGSYAASFENGRQGRIFLLVVVLHAAVLYGLLRYEHPLHLPQAESRIDLVWVKTPPPKPVAPVSAPQVRSKLVTTLPKVSTAPVAPPQEERHPAPDAPASADSTPPKPLDLEKILAEVGPAIRKLDSEQSGGHATGVQPGQPGFEKKLAQVLANAAPNPKFYEPARIEMISSGNQLDLGTIMYKITTFAGAYCVTYQDGAQIFKGTCPIKF